MHFYALKLLEFIKKYIKKKILKIKILEKLGSKIPSKEFLLQNGVLDGKPTSHM